MDVVVIVCVCVPQSQLEVVHGAAMEALYHDCLQQVNLFVLLSEKIKFPY